MEATVSGADGKVRCGWGAGDPLYRAYHDDEWGRPIHDERALFELLCLEAFQAGLAWITILRKRAAFRSAFAGFDPSLIAGYGEPDTARLMADQRIVRNRAKIEATIGNAQGLVAMHSRGEGIDKLAWSFAPPRPQRRAGSLGELPAQTPAAVELSRALKARGFRFVGPTIVYAFMEAAGIVDDHLAGCFVAAELDAQGSATPI